MKRNNEAMIAHGCAEAAKAGTIAGEYAAWDAVVAQHMPLEERPMRVPQWVKDSQAMNRAKAGSSIGPDSTGEGSPP